jgi:DNA-directed RNA polymerase specialized sigma subunit
MKIKNKQQLVEELTKVSVSLRTDFEKGVVEFVKRHDALTFEEIGKEIGIHKSEVSQICKRYGWERPRGNGSPASAVQRSK